MKYGYSKHEQVSSYKFKTHEKQSDEGTTLIKFAQTGYILQEFRFGWHERYLDIIFIYLF